MTTKTPDPILPQQNIEDIATEIARLKMVEREYQVTIKVLACLAEVVQTLTNGRRVEITDKMLTDSPDLTAWRDEEHNAVVIEVSRG